MNLFKKIGISFEGNYLMQGTLEEKIKFSKKQNIFNIGLCIEKMDKNINFKKIFDTYNKNIIFSLPTINYDLNNLKEIENLLSKILYKVNMVITKPSNLILSEYDWSTDDEKRKKVLKIAKGIALIASKKIIVAIENYKSEKEGYFGQNISHISDLLVYTRKILVEEYGFNESDASKYVKICINVDNVTKNSGISELNKWIDLFRESISCIKINDDKNLNAVLEKYLEYNFDCPILFIEKGEIEEIPAKMGLFVDYINIFSKNNNLNIKNEINMKTTVESGFTNIIVITMIVLTILIGILMIYVKFNV